MEIGAAPWGKGPWENFDVNVEQNWGGYPNTYFTQHYETQESDEEMNYMHKGKAKGKGKFQGNCNYCGKYGHRLNECWAKDQDMKGKGKGQWQKGEQYKGGKGGWTSKGFGKGNQTGKGMYWFDGPQLGQQLQQQTGGWQTQEANQWVPKLFALHSGPPGLEIRNRYEALTEEEPDYDEIPLGTAAHFPPLSRETFTKKTKKSYRELNPLIREDDETGLPELNAVSDTNRWLSVCPTTGFSKIKSVLDSGATDSCAPDCMCPEVKSRPTEGSKRGQMYTAAGGKKIPNEGEKHIKMITGANETVQTNWQTVDITRPLSSVRQICMQGNRVLFGAQGGVIYNIETGKETPFGVEDNVYVLDLWMPPTQDFARQG